MSEDGELVMVLERILKNEEGALEDYKEFFLKIGDARIKEFIETEKRHIKMVEEMIKTVRSEGVF